MSGSTDKILQVLEAEQIRRLNLTKEDLQKSYRKLAEQNFPDDQRIRFIADLGACKDAAYHIIGLFVKTGKKIKSCI